MDKLLLTVIDVETTLNAPKDIGSSHPMYYDNRAVYIGVLDSECVLPTFWVFEEAACLSMLHKESDFLVGCNLSFDLCYMYRRNPLFKTLLQKKRLWDIQLAEYLLSGQTEKWPSLDRMSVKYGYPIKDDTITKMFEVGIGADKIPEDLIKPYLLQDLQNTLGIAEQQIAKVVSLGMMDLVISQMEALHCVTEMMYNGMNVDYVYFAEYAGEVATEYADVQLKLAKDVNGVPERYYSIEDLASATQWSKLLFGGSSKVVEKEAAGFYKNGKPKFKSVPKNITYPPFSTIIPFDEWKSEKTGKVSVDEEVLKHISMYESIPQVKDIVKQLLLYREITKQLTTYIQGLGKHVIRNKTQDYIYSRINQVTTATGRLSSTSPNIQNISNNPIKAIFTSRYEDGYLIEFDFKQLEVAVLAHLTKCKQLIADIAGGADIHNELYKEMNGRYPDAATRKWFKRLTFGLIYGAGAKTLAVQAGCSIDVAKKFVVTFYARYPEVRAWNELMADRSNAFGVHVTTPEGLTSITRQWKYASETKRIYTFNEYKSKYEGTRDYTFSPTELKNYPVQGLATGDIVPLMLGIVFRELIYTPEVKLINTIHDSILLDCSNKAVLDGVIENVKRLLDNTHNYYQMTFGIPLALKLSAGVSMGKNWFEMKELEEV